MALLDRSAWYDIARSTNWTPKYVREEELFPAEQSDPFGIPTSEWETFDEPYKVSYREYVNVQREKDAGAYSVKAALLRSKYYEEKADPAYLSLLKMHYGAVALTEYAACQADARMNSLRESAIDAQHGNVRYAGRVAPCTNPALFPAPIGHA